MTSSPGRKKVIVVFPTSWDERQLPACRQDWQERFDVELVPPTDEDCPWDFDVVGFLSTEVERCRGAIDGVFSSSDYPGATVAGAIATRLGLPGSRPENVIRASHKFYSRQVQTKAAPEATPAYWLVDPDGAAVEGLRFPCFLKPVKGAFSVMSGRIDSPAELSAFLSKDSVREFLSGYVWMFNRLVAALTRFEVDGSHFLAEELVKGKQVTLEGFVTEDAVEVIGIVDSVGNRRGSFVRFEYPSTLPRRARERMVDVAKRVVGALELRHTMFNIELMYDARTDRIAIIEVNPRMCGQFADLYQKVDGTNGYEVALALAAGETPRLTRGAGRYRAAASFPLRIFEPSRVAAAPSEEDLREAQRLFDETLIWTECRRGDALVDFETMEDGKSARYAIVNVGAPDSGDLETRLDEIRQRLGYRFELAGET